MSTYQDVRGSIVEIMNDARRYAKNSEAPLAVVTALAALTHSVLALTEALQLMHQEWKLRGPLP